MTRGTQDGLQHGYTQIEGLPIQSTWVISWITLIRMISTMRVKIFILCSLGAMGYLSRLKQGDFYTIPILGICFWEGMSGLFPHRTNHSKQGDRTNHLKYIYIVTVLGQLVVLRSQLHIVIGSKRYFVYCLESTLYTYPKYKTKLGSPTQQSDS